ncbi:MAG: hypothetical protein Kow0029_29320 [Candidatus Rifleibacteriota bacterium]
MYCYEAHKCTRYDCPVQRNQVKRCWQFLEKLHKKAITVAECPYAPCDKCNYRLGWEIGLIGDSLFPDSPDPTPESLVPSPDETQEKDNFEKAENYPEKSTETNRKTLKDNSPPEEQLPENESESSSNTGKPPDPENEIDPSSDLLIEDHEKIGQPGMRFCHEILECPNPHCIVRRRQIIECYKFFSRRTAEDKKRLTCTDRKCQNCFYMKGWQMGLLHEGLFKDILESKKLKLEKFDRVKKNTLVEIYLAELANKPLSRQEEIALAKKIAGDREASELFLLANLKLVTRIAKQFSNKGLGLMDLIQEGNIGLIKAISKFDFTLGYRFSTYAAYWIRYYMQKALSNQGRTIRIPHHLLTVAHKIRKKIQEYEYANYCSPTLTELSRLLGIDEEKILTVIRITQTPISIHAKTGDDDEDETLEFYLTDKKNLTPEEMALEKLKNEAVQNAINELPDRLKYVVTNFYGFSDEEMSLAEIGRKLDISRERARQLLRQALQQLQRSEFIKEIS